jgi:N-acetylneuraminate synthase
METYIIAEVGTSHGGDLERAADLIHAAAESGANCAKFQCVIADEIVHQHTGAISLPGGEIDIYQRFRDLERPVDFYARLKELCDAARIDFLCTSFGTKSAEIVEDLKPDAHKVASPETNHIELLQVLRDFGRPIILSTGVTSLADIEQAVAELYPCELTILHCVTDYPADEVDYNLRLLPALQTVFGLKIGVSDHTLDPALVPTLSVSQGACMIEKHFTLSRTGTGLDDPIALNPSMFSTMTASVRRADALLDSSSSEGRTILLDQLIAEYGRSRVDAVLGNGVKKMGKAETDHYSTTRRSLLAIRDLPEGHRLTRNDVAALRSEALSPGLSPLFLPILLGVDLKEALSNGEGLRWEHVL